MKTSNHRQLGFAVVALLFASIAFLRLIALDADAPLGISTGQELSTDPPQYTSFARNKALYGSWEVFHTRYRLFVYNLTTLFSYLIYIIAGTGRAESNLGAALLSFGTIVLNYLVWKQRALEIALLATVLLGFNYTFYWFGKQPFLETTTIFMVSAGAVLLLAKWSKTLGSFVAGIVFAVAALFGKLLVGMFLPIGLILLFVDNRSNNNTNGFARWTRPAAYLLGYFLICIFWIVLVYFPYKTELQGYLSEISTGLYGAPKALESIEMFIIQLFSYGFDNRLWSHLLIELAIGFLGVTMVIGSMCSFRKGFWVRINRIDLFYLLWVVTAFAFLFPWNYRPVRYATILFPPLAYFGGMWITMLFNSPLKFGKIMWVYYSVLFASGSYIAYQCLIAPKFEFRSLSLIAKMIPLGLLGGFILCLAGFFIQKSGLMEWSVISDKWKLGKWAAVAIIVTLMWNQTFLLGSSLLRDQRTIHNASSDVGKILSRNAVVAGSYSSALTQDNQLKSVIKMFSGPAKEGDFFEKLPITHVAVESGLSESSNEGRAFRDFPQVMRTAPIVATYYLRGYPVDLFLISSTTTNAEARRYEPSLYELAASEFSIGNLDSARVLVGLFEKSAPNTYAASQLRMKIYMAKMDFEKARDELVNQLGRDEGNLSLWLMLSQAELGLGTPDIEGAVIALSKALVLNPDDKNLKRKLELLKENRR